MNLRETCYKVATFGGWGEWLGGGVLASFAAIPLVLIGRLVYSLVPSLFYWFAGIIFVGICAAVQLAHGVLEEKDPSVLVISKTVGMAIAFFGIPLYWADWKLILIGFIFFFILSFLKPVLMLVGGLKNIMGLPGAVGLLIGDILFGGVVNLILRLSMFIFGSSTCP
jgi:phosphatidylglycerophosphatase A